MYLICSICLYGVIYEEIGCIFNVDLVQYNMGFVGVDGGAYAPH